MNLVRRGLGYFFDERTGVVRRVGGLRPWPWPPFAPERRRVPDRRR